MITDFFSAVKQGGYGSEKMNLCAVLHIPGTVDICPCEDGRIRLRLRTARDDFAQVRLVYSCNKYNWTTERHRTRMKKAFADSDFDYYAAAIPLTDTRFAYIFELLRRDGELFYLSEEGISRSYDQNLAYFSFFQYPSMYEYDRVKVPGWVRTAVAYQIFPERFAIGDPARDLTYVNAAWGEKPTPKSFYGGDLTGILKKLPYLSELGVRLLYLTPVFCSPSNHKYDVTDYETVDPAFGGNEALRALIAEAHARGMRVMLDGVFNHCSSSHPFFRDVREKGRASRYYNWFFIDGERPDPTRGNYQTFGSVPYMPKLNTENPEVIEYFADVACRWMRDYGADAWRLDVSDEISHRFLRRFRERVLAERPDAIIIGEDWHQATRYLSGDEYDGVMNYALCKACLDLFAFGTIDAAAFRDRLVRLYHRQNVAASEKMLNLLDSHDTERFLTRVGGDARKYRAAAAIQFFYPGLPCVYYGDEIGMQGGYDPDSRRCFDWREENWDRETRELLQRLIRMKRRPPLSEGSFAIEEEDGVLRLIRRTAEEQAVLTLNAAAEARAGLAPFAFRITETGRKEQEEGI